MKDLGRRLPVSPAVICLAIAVIASGIFLLDLTSPLYFVLDEWDLVLLRQGWGLDAFFAPFHEHIVLAPSFIYHLLLGIFGQSSARPFQVTATATFLLCAVLLFVWMRRRVGDWAALIGTVMILFLGAAFEDLVWAFQIGYFGSLAGGLGALVALDRDDRKGDIIASVLLLVSVTFSSLALPFIAGAWVEWYLNPRPRRNRLFMPLVSTAFYGFWWLGWGHDAKSSLSFANLIDSPRYMFEAASAGFVSLFGLATGDGSEPSQPHLIWGRIMLIAFIAFGWWRVRRSGFSRSLAVVLVIGLSSLFLTALNHNDLRPPTSSRYQLATSIFILLVAAELLRGVKFKPAVLAVAAVVAALSINGGISLMRDRVDARWIPNSESTKASLAALTIAGDSMADDFQIDLGLEEPVPQSDYLRSIEDHGRLGYSESELESRDPSVRTTVDSTLMTALGLELTAATPPTGELKCRKVKPASTAAKPLTITPGSYAIANSGRTDLTIFLGRFSDAPVLPLGSILAGSGAGLEIPFDSSSRPWEMALDGTGTTTVCG